MVNAEQPVTGVVIAPPGLFDQRRELCADVVALVGKAGERDARASYLDDERARGIEDVNVPMSQQPRMREARPLMVSGNYEHRNSKIGNSFERLVRLMRDTRVGR